MWNCERVKTRHQSGGSDSILAAVPVAVPAAVTTAVPSSPGKRKSAFVPPPSYEDFSREAEVVTAKTLKPSVRDRKM